MEPSSEPTLIQLPEASMKTSIKLSSELSSEPSVEPSSEPSFETMAPIPHLLPLNKYLLLLRPALLPTRNLSSQNFLPNGVDSAISLTGMKEKTYHTW